MIIEISPFWTPSIMKKFSTAANALCPVTAREPMTELRAISAASRQRRAFEPEVPVVVTSMSHRLSGDGLGLASLAGLIGRCLTCLLGLVVERCEVGRPSLVDALLGGNYSRDWSWRARSQP